jgi:SAM-dependent methyltransferase
MSEAAPTVSLPVSHPNAAASNASFEFAALQEADNYRAALIKSFRPFLRGQVLEVGAGVGQMSESLRALKDVSRHVAVEPDEKFLPHLREIIPPADLVAGTAKDVPPTTRWDALVSINVLEHIEHDNPELALYRQLLAPQRGHLCLFVPARQEIYAPLDRDFGHFRRYQAPALRAQLERAGFEIVTLRYYNIIGYLAWWWSFCVRKQRTFNVGSVRFYDRVLFPPIFWLEHTLCPPPIGQSLLVVARARA